MLSVVTLTQPLLLQLSQNRIYYCYSMHLKKITKYTMWCRRRFDRMCWFPKLTCCCWPRRKQIVSTMYKNNNIFNCFTWVKIEWWLFIGIYMVTFMIPLSLTDNIDNTFSMLNLHGAPWKVAISMMWFILASNLIIYFPFLSRRSVYIDIQKPAKDAIWTTTFIFGTFLELYIKSLSFGSKTAGSVKMV